MSLGRGRRVLQSRWLTAATNVGQANRGGSKPELRVRSKLHSMGLRFRKDYRIDFDGLQVRPDIVFLRAKVAVFIDGCYFGMPVQHTSRRQDERYLLGTEDGIRISS